LFLFGLYNWTIGRQNGSNNYVVENILQDCLPQQMTSNNFTLYGNLDMICCVHDHLCTCISRNRCESQENSLQGITSHDRNYTFAVNVFGQFHQYGKHLTRVVEEVGFHKYNNQICDAIILILMLLYLC
jgi:hypothetical protein